MLYKYPRTPHLPWSPGRTKDDKILKDTSNFEEKHIVVSIKMDGENTTLYSNYMHARSIDSKDHESRHWIKAFWSNIRWLIPKGWRICGENMYAKHSIQYNDLESYFLVFSIWNDKNECLPYWETKDYCDLWDLVHVPIIYNGFWLDKMDAFLKARFDESASGHEGYVVRNYDSFHFDNFERNVAKYVRENHVQTDTHWLYQKIVPNNIANKHG